MELEMVLNELSLQPLARDIPEARQRMSDLVSTMSTATKSGVSRSLRTPQNIKSEQIAVGYSIGRWLKDHEVDSDRQRYFMSLALRAPYLVDIGDQTVVDDVENAEFVCNEDCAIGLGVAYRLDALALSIRSEVRWHPHRLALKHIYLDSDGELLYEDITVTHASHKDHILEHKVWIKERTRLDIQDGSDLWQHRERQFPGLQFCASVGEALQSLNAGNCDLHLVAKKLGELEKACQQWREQGEGLFDIQLKGSPDSEATLLKYPRERTFYCPDGKTRLFSSHIRINCDWRIYYYKLGETKQLIIGYIGKHLPTMKDS